MTKPLDVICLGHAAFDRVHSVDAMPASATKMRATAYREVGGGMAANAACAIARLGGRAAFWGRAGDDAAGVAMAREFDAYGVDASGFRRFAGCRSSQSTVIVDARGERLIVSFWGDAPEDPAWLPLDDIARAKAVLADVRWPAGAHALFAAARRAGVPSVLDADVAEPAILEALVREAEHVVFSSHGLARWAGIAPHAGTSDHRAAHGRAWRTMREANPRARACAVTAGAEGSWWIVDGVASHVPAPSVVAVDTLAAGDVFHGAYALALAEGVGIRDAAHFASCAAAIKCTRAGGRDGAPTRAEVDARLGAG